MQVRRFLFTLRLQDAICISMWFLDRSIDLHSASKQSVYLHVCCTLGVDLVDILYSFIFSILGHMLIVATFVTMLRAEHVRRCADL